MSTAARPERVAEATLQTFGDANPDAGVRIFANDHCRVVVEIQGLIERGEKPKPVSLGFSPEEFEDLIEELPAIAEAARAERVKWKECDVCHCDVPVDDPTYPDCDCDPR